MNDRDTLQYMYSINVSLLRLKPFYFFINNCIYTTSVLLKYYKYCSVEYRRDWDIVNIIPLLNLMESPEYITFTIKNILKQHINYCTVLIHCVSNIKLPTQSITSTL